MPRETLTNSFDAAMYYGLRGLAIAATVAAVVYGYNGGDPEANEPPPVIFGVQLPSVFGEPIKTKVPRATQTAPSLTITIPTNILRAPLEESSLLER